MADGHAALTSSNSTRLKELDGRTWLYPFSDLAKSIGDFNMLTRTQHWSSSATTARHRRTRPAPIRKRQSRIAYATPAKDRKSTRLEMSGTRMSGKAVRKIGYIDLSILTIPITRTSGRRSRLL